MTESVESIVVRAIEPTDVDALTALFVRDGSPCFCRYWHFAGTNKEWEARCAFESDVSARELREAVEQRRDDGLGIVAAEHGTNGDEIVGWLKLAPRATLTKLLTRSPYKDLEAPPETLGVACFLVDPRHRRRGVAAALLDGAIAHARVIGAKAIEAWPRTSTDGSAPLHDGELFQGPASLFASRGFSWIRRDPPHPTLRLDLS